MVRPCIYCYDGFAMSVQDHENAYATPGSTSEIGFPTKEEPLIKEYAEDPDDLTGTVYPHVPNEIVEQVIIKHGGVDPNGEKKAIERVANLKKEEF